ncbi:hypothetical protein LJ737_01695 [Hymenobacter sp. 15J16-1T3B]|uniref:hypothetical protein n=1 Tax=Hymenobacter sp. 15J16-1T3B TaxID=2886941 RepID=UPI001D11F415|nr:hypothetical protein [Hymenobacter sp. 15J16-1T3B]MCC3155932.1 hypothetical protein [Hymenobacter sp. 15J16-1T3B]
MKKILPFLALSVLAACSSDKEAASSDAIMSNDFESVVGWVPDASTISKDHAHSGAYALKVDPSHEFSLTYNTVLGNVTARKPRGVKLEAWAYLNSAQSAGKLGLVVVPPGENAQNVVGDGIELSEVKDFKKWVKVSKEIVFPASVQSDYILKVFLWRGAASEPVYIDDLKLTALE